MNAQEMLRALTEPIKRGDKIASVIADTATLVGLTYSRCYEIYYGRARRIGPDEIARISDALERKDKLDARNELQALRIRLTRLENLLVSNDADFHRTEIDFVRAQVRRPR